MRNNDYLNLINFKVKLRLISTTNIVFIHEKKSLRMKFYLKII